MPPRKRTETKPPEPQDEGQVPIAEPDTEAAGQQETAPSDPAPQPPEAPAAPASGETPAKSDIQTVDTPCPDCFPHGWPDLAFSVGCGHGTWKRS